MTIFLFKMNDSFVPHTQEQQGLYWVWVGEIAKQLEMEPEEVHDSFKGMFNEGKSTMKMHLAQYTDYMSKISSWCQENKIDLPE